jgi:hypothetical protein
MFECEMIEMEIEMDIMTFDEAPIAGEVLELDGELATVLAVEVLEGDGSDMRVWIEWI